jgi:hypothetical protein
MMALSTLPSDIPDLLQDCSPIYYGNLPGVVIGDPDASTAGILVMEGAFRRVPLHDLKLRIDHKTGRAHAAWWAISTDDGSELFAPERGKLSVLCGLAEAGKSMTPEQVNMLARLCLRLAGRSP